MKNKMSIVIAGLLLALLVVGVTGATNAFAQSSSNVAWHGGGPGDGHGFRLGTAELEAAAKTLNMTTDELSTALQGGKTLEQIATEKGVDYAKVQDAVQAAHVAEMRARIQQALDDGSITKENADWLFEGLDRGFIGVPGAFGFGGPHGGEPSFGRGPQAQPTQQSAQ